MCKFIALIFTFALVACSHVRPLATSANSCPEPQGLPAGQLLLFGEMHGSVEAPELISEIACALSRSDEIAVGLEIPSRDQPLIDAYLKSSGSRAAVEALTSNYFWQKGRDGRSSAAMLQLIEAIRKLKGSGHAVDVFAFDDQPGTNLERNVAIANGVRRFHSAHPSTRIIALMGNAHAMQSEMMTNDGNRATSGRLLIDLNPSSILVTYPAGTIWACMPACGVHKLTPKNPSAGAPGFKEGAPMDGYSHTFLLPSITASPPALQQ